MITIGIDPGLSGALVALDNAGRLVCWHDTPTVQLKKGKAKRDYMVREMVSALKSLIVCIDNAEAWIEVQQAFPGQGVSTMFKTGRGYGVWEGIVAALGLRYELVRPATWQRAMLKDVPGDGKTRGLLKASQLFPDLPLTAPRGHKLTKDGRADAALIAHYGLTRRGSGAQPEPSASGNGNASGSGRVTVAPSGRQEVGSFAKEDLGW